MLLLPSGLEFPQGIAAGFDRAHPAALGARFSGVATGTGFVSLLTGQPGTVVGTVTQTQNAAGPAINTANGTAGYVSFPGPNETVAAATFGGIYTPTSAPFFGTFINNNGISAFSGFCWIPQSITAGLRLFGSSTTPSLSFPWVPGNAYFFAVSINATRCIITAVNLATGKTYTNTTTNTYASYNVTSGFYSIAGSNTTVNGLNGGLSALMYSANNSLSSSQLMAWAADPWAFWYPAAGDVGIAPQPSFRGTLALPEPADAVALSGAAQLPAALAAIEPADTASFPGTAARLASLAVPEPSDAASLSGLGALTGIIALAEPSDLAALIGVAALPGSLALAEPADVGSFVGSAARPGTLVLSEPADAVSIFGAGKATGSFVLFEPGDLTALAGAAMAVGVVSLSEPSDEASIAGSVAMDGVVALLETGDGGSIAGFATMSGLAALIEPADTASFGVRAALLRPRPGKTLIAPATKEAL